MIKMAFGELSLLYHMTVFGKSENVRDAREGRGHISSLADFEEQNKKVGDGKILSPTVCSYKIPTLCKSSINNINGAMKRIMTM